VSWNVLLNGVPSGPSPQEAMGGHLDKDLNPTVGFSADGRD
jgi:hypothetical protein